MKKFLWLLVALVSLSGCGEEGGKEELLELKPYGETTYEPNSSPVPETGSPTRQLETEVPSSAELGTVSEYDIVSLSPTVTEMLFALGVGDWVVAVDNQSNWPPEAPMVEELSGVNPDIEMITDYGPELVVVGDKGLGEKLLSGGLNVWVPPEAGSLEDVFQQIKALGTLTTKPDEARQLIDTIEEGIVRALSGLDRPDEPLTYYHELDNNLYSVASSTLVGQIYGLIGLVNVADPVDEASSSSGYPQLTQEYLLEADPDIIFFADAKCCAQTA